MCAVIFGSTSSVPTQLVTSRPAAEVVMLLNRFFAVIVDEVNHHRGLVNKFQETPVASSGPPTA